jgi:hypothetical protein
MMVMFRVKDSDLSFARTLDNQPFPRKDDYVIVAGAGSGKVDRITWVIYPGADHVVQILVKDWEPAPAH